MRAPWTIEVGSGNYTIWADSARDAAIAALAEHPEWCRVTMMVNGIARVFFRDGESGVTLDRPKRDDAEKYAGVLRDSSAVRDALAATAAMHAALRTLCEAAESDGDGTPDGGEDRSQRVLERADAYRVAWRAAKAAAGRAIGTRRKRKG